MNAHDIVLLGELVGRCPSLLEPLQAHLDAYDGLLSHLFMAEVARWAVERHATAPGDAELARALDYLEGCFAAGRPEDREIIAASFLENLPPAGGPGADLRDALGPALSAQLSRFG
jgi:hypothetical protein